MLYYPLALSSKDNAWEFETTKSYSSEVHYSKIFKKVPCSARGPGLCKWGIQGEYQYKRIPEVLGRYDCSRTANKAFATSHKLQ